MGNIFTDHPHSIGESYFQHLRFALNFGGSMALGGLACMMHAVCPFVFKKTGSDILLRLAQDFVNRMPFVEDRVIHLSRAIERKMAQTAVQAEIKQ